MLFYSNNIYNISVVPDYLVYLKLHNSTDAWYATNSRSALLPPLPPALPLEQRGGDGGMRAPARGGVHPRPGPLLPGRTVGRRGPAPLHSGGDNAPSFSVLQLQLWRIEQPAPAGRGCS